MNTKMFSVFVALALACAPLVLAIPNGGDSMDALCQAKGFDFGIAKWQAGKDGWVLVDSIDGYTTEVSGDPKGVVSYTSSPLADGVLSNGASDVYPGEGTLEKGVNHNGNVEQVTFCGSTPEVPEFGGILAVGTIGLLGAAAVVARRS